MGIYKVQCLRSSFHHNSSVFLSWSAYGNPSMLVFNEGAQERRRSDDWTGGMCYLSLVHFLEDLEKRKTLFNMPPPPHVQGSKIWRGVLTYITCE